MADGGLLLGVADRPLGYADGNDAATVGGDPIRRPQEPSTSLVASAWRSRRHSRVCMPGSVPEGAQFDEDPAGARGEGDLGGLAAPHLYPFTAPFPNPTTNCLCATKNNAMHGTMVTIDTAMR